MRAEQVKKARRAWVPGQEEEIGSPHIFQAIFDQEFRKAAGAFGQTVAGLGLPIFVEIAARADFQSRAGHGPGAGSFFQPVDDFGRRDNESKPQARQPKNFPNDLMTMVLPAEQIEATLTDGVTSANASSTISHLF